MDPNTMDGGQDHHQRHIVDTRSYMEYTLPTLTLSGWVKDKYTIMVKLFEYFITSDKSQSVLFYNEVYSLKKILSIGHNPDKIIEEIKTGLNSLYSKYFNRVIVHVDILNKNDEDTFLYLNIDITAYHNNDRYVLSKRIKTSNGDIKNYNELLENLFLTYNIIGSSRGY